MHRSTNMDDLPLELKQRVCSYLTLKDLKSFRLTAKFYAAATDRYLVPRIFLSNHPDSFQEIQDITDHPELRHSVTTLVVDTRCLPLISKYEEWARQFADAELKSADKSVARAERALCREKNRERWSRYRTLALAQRTTRKLMLDGIALAVQRCPRLSNLIVQHHGKQDHGIGLDSEQGYIYHNVDLRAGKHARYLSPFSFDSMRFSIWRLLKPFHVVGRALNSLVLLDEFITCPRGWIMPSTTVFQNLKHLRFLGSFSIFLSQIVARAPELESIGVHGKKGGWNACALQLLIGESVLRKLRACSLSRLAQGEDDLVEFLLRHSNSLQHLRITNESESSTLNWAGFVLRMRGQLPNLRRAELRGLKPPRLFVAARGWVNLRAVNEDDLLQGHVHDLETGPMEIEEGLWEDYEDLFFPDKQES